MGRQLRAGFVERVVRYGETIQYDFEPVYRFLVVSGFVSERHYDETPLLYDNGDRCPWAKDCYVCEETNHVNNMHRDPASYHSNGEELVCDFCLPKSALELMVFWEHFSNDPNYLIDELWKCHPWQLRLIADLREEYGTYAHAYRTIKSTPKGGEE